MIAVWFCGRRGLVTLYSYNEPWRIDPSIPVPAGCELHVYEFRLVYAPSSSLSDFSCHSPAVVLLVLGVSNLLYFVSLPCPGADEMDWSPSRNWTLQNRLQKCSSPFQQLKWNLSTHFQHFRFILVTNNLCSWKVTIVVLLVLSVSNPLFASRAWAYPP